MKEPVFIVHEEKCRRNIELMRAKALCHNLDIRPHFKTHQSAVIGKWFWQAGITKIAVSSIKMARYFAKNGWGDITIAIPMNPGIADDINTLAGIVNLNVVIICSDTITALESKIANKIGVFIEIDNGYNRTGLLPGENETISYIIDRCSSNRYFEFRGFLTHAGNTYNARGYNEVSAIHLDSLLKLKSLKNRYQNSCKLICSYGDTPSCSMMNNFDGIDEIRPGNFVFFDLMQEQIGSCSMENIAVILAVPILAKHSSRNELVVEGGAIHLSKESIIDSKERLIFGYPVMIEGNEWQMPDKESYVRSVSQEHGVIKASESFFKSVKVGDRIGILPVHSCLAAHQMRHYYNMDGVRIETMNSEFDE